MSKVLIVSPADMTPVLGETVLWGKGVERVFASSHSAALDVARAFLPSLVVLDGGDAPPTLGLIRQLREHPGTRRSSIVVVSDSPTSGAKEDLLRAGANLALGAPVDGRRWDALFERLLAVPRRVRARFPVRLRRARSADERPFTGESVDISVTGMLVETDAGVDPGARLELSFTLPEGGEELRATASVVRSSPETPARIGLAFRRFDEGGADQLRALLAAAPVAAAFGRYEVLGSLGEGSMGSIYRAFDPVAQRVVAIKTLKPELRACLDAEDYARRFRSEAQAAAKLVHPNIVTIFDVGDDYFVMELLEGATLQALLRERNRLDPETACRMLAPVADALDFAHSRGTIHRDVKPANIMVSPDGLPKVMDFGVAHLVTGSMTAPGDLFGSPFYMAPEQITGNVASPQTDIFSLAVVAYEALAGRKPFEAEGVSHILHQVVHRDPPRVSTWSPGLPPHYDSVLQRALAKDPRVRFPTARAFVAALQSGAGGDAAPPLLTTPAADAGFRDPADPRMETHDLRDAAKAIRGGSRRRAVVAATSLALAAIVSVLALWPARPAPRGAAPPPGLAITTVPPGATVWLDGAAVGTTPLFLSNVLPASHRVRVAAEGYVSSELSVRTTGEATAMPLRFILQQATGTLELDSDPAPALVRVDGRARGTTPFSDNQMAPGTHRVLVELPGYRSFSRAVDVSPGKTERLAARLERDAELSPGDDASLRRLGWVRVGDLVLLGPGVTPPWRIAGEPAPYPEEARRLQIEGSAAVELTVSETGDVLDARVVESAGELLDQALLATVPTWRYEPAQSNGVKVRVRIVERQRFSLSDP